MQLAFATPVTIRHTRLLTTLTNPLRSRLSLYRTPSRHRPRTSFTMTSTAPSTTAARTHAHGYQYDLFVIGAGSGGVRAARIAANHSAHVAVAENGRLGGTCVNVGCVPKKLFVYGSHYGHDFHDASAYGWNVEQPTLDWPRLISNKNAEIDRLNGIYGRLLDGAGVELITGTAKFVDPHTIQVGDNTYTADKILVATGGKPFVPEFEGREHVITSNEAFYLKDLPKHVVVVGGGYIAVEFACIFHGFGSNVVQLYRGEKFLRGFDDEVRDHLATEMRTQGVDLRFKMNVKNIVKNDDGTFKVTTTNDDVIDTDLVMYATGRVPNSDTLGLKEAGVETGAKGKILVDEWSKSNVDHIYAVGDVTDRVNLTPVAIAEGHAFADTVYGNKPRNIGYDNIATAVFSTPSIGTCGLTESQAREKYGKLGVDIYKTSFRPMKHTLTKREGEKVFMKLIVVKETDVVVGCHMLDSAAGDMIQLVGVAMKAGATKAHFDSTIPVHPVSAEELVTMRTKQPDPSS